MTPALTKALAAPALLFALAVPLAAPAQAQDARVREVAYEAARVVRIEGKVTVQASIVFAEDELIENVAIGDAQAWQVTPNKRANILFVKPLATRASTNMTVVTSKRTYLFDLVASPGARALYVLRFRYPDEPKPGTGIALAGPDGIEQQATEPGAVVDPAELNFAWKASGDRALLPARTFDDGVLTYLSWPQGRAVPAILITDSKGTEGPVNYTVRGDTIVVEGVPQLIVLRSGKDSATLTNTGPVRPETAALASNTENN